MGKKWNQVASEIIRSESEERKWLYRKGGQAVFEAGSANFVFILFVFSEVILLCSLESGGTTVSGR